MKYKHKHKHNKDLERFLEETYKWFAKIFKEEVKFDEEGNIYTIPTKEPKKP